MDPIKLTNAEFPFSFMEREFQVKKANLQQVILFRRKVKEILEEKDAGGELRMVAYAIFLVLSAADKNVTEEQVLENCPGAIEITDLLVTLGFLNQQKAATMTQTQNALEQKPTGEDSTAQ